MTLLYIGGAGRSGSTLLDRLLGMMPGVTALGEIRFLWAYLARGGVRCGCGVALPACAFWQGVLERWQADASLSVRAMAEWTQQWDRTRHGHRFRSRHSADRPYIEHWGRLYRVLDELTGSDVLVDASKIPTHLCVLQRAAVEDIRVLHLVRDPRAVAFSWGWRVKPEPAVMQAGATMPRRHPLAALAAWIVENEAIRRMHRRYPYARLRYEDFTNAPQAHLHTALQNLGLEVTLDGASMNAWPARPTHSVGGNPIRFTRSPQPIRTDTSWQSALPRAWYWTLTGLGWLYLRRYGYRT